jgi:Tfp pilus assembly PilM family ATPase
MSLYKNHAGFQISTSKLRLVEVGHKDDIFSLENIDEEFFSDFLNFSDKETKLITILQNAFNEIILRNQLSSNIVSFTLPANLFNIIDIPYDDALTKKDLQEHLKWELSLLLPELDSNDIAMQSIDISDSILRKGNNIILILLQKKIIQLLIKFCNRNNLTLRYIDNEHLSAINLLSLNQSITSSKIYLTLLVRETYASIVLIENTIPINVDVFLYEGVSELIEKLNKKLESISTKFDEVIDIEKSFVFGDALTQSALLKIQETTGLILESTNPFKKLNCTNQLTDKLNSYNDVGHFTSAAGISVRLI